MKDTAKRAICGICSMAVVLVYMAGITAVPVKAADNGIYTATVTTHYRNPQTGSIEDSGGEGSYALGQSMTESTTNKEALVEVDASGTTYVTIRMQMMDNITNVEYSVDGSSVSSTLMQEDYSVNTADYRFKVNSEASLIKCKMYIEAMGRSVVYFMTLSDLRSGSGDFITSISVSTQSTATEKSDASETAAQGTEPAQTSEQAKTSESGTSAESAAKEDAVNSDTTDSDSTNTGSADTAAESNGMTNGSSDQAEDGNAGSVGTTASAGSVSDAASANAGTTAGTGVSGTAKVEGIQEYDASGNKVEAADSTNETEKESRMGWIITAVLLVICVAGGSAYYFMVYKKKAGER